MALLIRFDSFDASATAESGAIAVSISVVDSATPTVVRATSMVPLPLGLEQEQIMDRIRHAARQALRKDRLTTRLTALVGQTVPLEGG